jgi:hypothetical protein
MNRVVVSPGYFECTSGRPEMAGVAPGGAPVYRNVACGHRYQEGTLLTTAGVCACKTNAIGTCAECGQPVCHDHSSLLGGVRICGSCIRARQERTRRPAMAAHEQALAEISAVPELTERMLRLFLYQSMYAPPQGRDHSGDDLYRVCPEYEPKRAQIGHPNVWGDRVPWDYEAIARWFLDQAARQGLQPQYSFRMGARRKLTSALRGAGRDTYKPVGEEIRCWLFQGGSTTTVPSGADPRNGSRPDKVADALVLGDGRIVAPFHWEGPLIIEFRPTVLNHGALLQMAGILDLSLRNPSPVLKTHAGASGRPHIAGHW